MCKKTLNENSEHIFVKCELAENFFDFIKNAKSLIQNISKRKNANEIRIYKKNNNEETSNKKEILDDLFEFYKELLGNERVREEVIKNYKFKIKKLEKTIKEKYPEIGWKITYDEAWEVIKI
jgi:hypothetical protein